MAKRPPHKCPATWNTIFNGLDTLIDMMVGFQQSPSSPPLNRLPVINSKDYTLPSMSIASIIHDDRPADDSL